MAGSETNQLIVQPRYVPLTEAESFAEELREWIRTAPWFLVSVVIHAMIAFVLANLDWQTYETSEAMVLEASYEHNEIEPLPEEELEDEMDQEFEEVEEMLDDPVVTEDAVEVVNEEFIEEEVAPIDAPFEGRSVNDVIGIGGGGSGGAKFGGKYHRRASKKGGGRATEKAVEWGLDWLKRHQEPDGFWDCDGFQVHCTNSPCTGRGQALNNVGVTGLTLLAFLGAGNTVSTGPYKDVVKKGVHYLCQVQDPEDGCLVAKEGTHWMYNHGIAALALTEAYGLSKWPILKKHAQWALDFIHESKNPGRAWRYNNGEIDPVEQNDVSVTGWMVMCLASAKDFGLRYEQEDVADALRYIDAMTDSTTGRTGYKERGSFSSREDGDDDIWPFDQTEAMTAVAMLCQVFAGNMLGDMKSRIPALEAGAALLRKKLPEWSEEKGTIDFYYWYYGSFAMYQMAGRDWQVWKTAMEKALVESQRQEGCARGSWDPQKDPWGDNGGRVYATALNTLCLEVFYRYDHVLGAR
jgi:hypothetical protein